MNYSIKSIQSSLTNLQSQYPYQTPIVGKGTDGWQKTSGTYRKVKPVSGGVGIVSKWPIVEQEQHIYKKGCGADKAGNKGFAYIKINKMVNTSISSEHTFKLKIQFVLKEKTKNQTKSNG